MLISCRQESSQARHVRRCLQATKGKPRRKACRRCALAKTRCDLRRPTCGTCRARDTCCDFLTPDSPPATESPPELYNALDVSDSRVHGDQRRHDLLDADLSLPEPPPETLHTMHFVTRVLKSWPRKVAMHGLAILPPMIHRLQLEDGIPVPLANCCTLAKMWFEQMDGSGELVHTSIVTEVRRLLREVCKLLARFSMPRINVCPVPLVR